MDKKIEKWINDVLTSMQGSQRAKPKTELFTKINNQFINEKVIINSKILYKYAIVAICLLLMNSITLVYYFKHHQINTENVTSLDAYNKALTNNSYQIY